MRPAADSDPSGQCGWPIQWQTVTRGHTIGGLRAWHDGNLRSHRRGGWSDRRPVTGLFSEYLGNWYDRPDPVAHGFVDVRPI